MRYALSAATHKVKKGETLQQISKKYQVSVDKLKSLNGLTSDKLSSGQRLVVNSDRAPSIAKRERTRAPAKKYQRNFSTASNGVKSQAKNRDSNQDNNQDQFIQYKIAKGDTLEGLAEKFDLEKDEIIDLNNLRKKRLTPGKVIKLPRTESDNEELVTLGPDARSVYASINFGTSIGAGSTNSNGGMGILKRWKSEDERGMLVKVAKSFAGAPYRYGGESVRGLDCSAYVKKIYEIFEVQLPRSAREQYSAGQRVASNDITTGDLVFFRTSKHLTYPTHVGIYIGDGRFIHSSSYCRQGVRINSLSEEYYSRRFIGAVRVKTVPESQDSARASQKDSGNNS